MVVFALSPEKTSLCSLSSLKSFQLKEKCLRNTFLTMRAVCLSGSTFFRKYSFELQSKFDTCKQPRKKSTRQPSADDIELIALTDVRRKTSTLADRSVCEKMQVRCGAAKCGFKWRVLIFKGRTHSKLYNIKAYKFHGGFLSEIWMVEACMSVNVCFLF